MTNRNVSPEPLNKPYSFRYGRYIMQYDPITQKTSVIDERPLSNKHIVKQADGSWRFADVSQATKSSVRIGREEG